MNTAETQKSIHGAAHSPRERDIAAGHAASDVMREFPTEDACLEFIKETRWPKGIVPCAKCGVPRKHHRVIRRKAYACDRCGTHLYPLRGTAFGGSSTSLLKWFRAAGLLASAEPRITARRIQRETGVTYKTAWRMLHRLRATGVSRALSPRRFLELTVACATPPGACEKRAPVTSLQGEAERHG